MYSKYRSIRVTGGALSFLIVFLLVGINSALALEPTDKWEGTIDYAATGGSFLDDTCTVSAFGCFPPGDGQGDIVNGTSTAVLAGIPEGVHILKAMLVWMGSLQHGLQAADREVHLQPPQGDKYPVTVPDEDPIYEEIYEGTDLAGQDQTFHYYTIRADVTNILRTHYVTEDKSLNGDYTISDFSGWADEPYKGRTVALGGWSLVIIYSNPGGQAKRIYYYTDFRAIHDEVVTLTPSGFDVPFNPEAKVTFFLGEGDDSISGTGVTGTYNEEIKFNGVQLTDSCNPLDNAYNGTVNTNLADGEACRTNQYSIDLDTFYVSDLLSPGDTDATILFSLGQDQAFSNYIILSIDTRLPDFDIPDEPEKGASVASGQALYPGQDFTYYIYVQNNGEDVATNVIVKDPLPSVVTYIANSTYVVEPSGERRHVPDPVENQPPSLTGIAVADNIPPGEPYRRTVEIGVRLNSLEQGVSKETIVENTAQIISGNGDIYFTNGGVPIQHTVRLESYEGKLYFNKGGNHPESRFVTAGQTDVVAAHVSLQALEGPVQISSLKFTPKETADAGVVSMAALYLDNNNDGVVDSGDTQIGQKTSWVGGGLAFDDFSALPTVAKDEKHSLILTVDVDEDATPGMIGQLELTEEGVSIRGFKYGLPFDCSLLYLPSADTDVSIEMGYHNPAAAFLPKTINAPVMQLLLRAYDEAVSINGITFVAEGTLYDPSEVDQISLYRDANGNGALDNGESQLGESKSFSEDNGNVTFSNLNIALAANEEVNLLAVAAFDNVAVEKKFRINVMDNANVDAGGATVFGAPITGSLFTFVDEVVGCETDEDCWASMGQNFICDDFEKICIDSGSSTDGDTVNPTDGDGFTPIDGDFPVVDGDEPEEDGGGCHSAAGNMATGGLLLLSLLAGIIFWRRRA